MSGHAVIPGGLDWRLLADMHRPTDPVAMASEIRRLATSAFNARDIAVALKLDVAYVLEALRGAERGDA